MPRNRPPGTGKQGEPAPANPVVAGVGAAILEAAREREASFRADAAPPGGMGRTGERGSAPRLGWVDLPLRAASLVDAGESLRAELAADGIGRVVVVGMGGSGLGAETLVATLPPREDRAAPGGLAVESLNSPAPEAARAAVAPDRVPETAYLIASKSGTTVETVALESVIVAAVARSGGSVARQLLALSDPGSPLLARAGADGWRAAFRGNAEVGGRFSALSPYGLYPAALAGRELRRPLRHAVRLRRALDDGGETGPDPGLGLGALLAALHDDAGRRQVHLSAEAGFEPLLAWLEQLFAESAGKDGKGFLPVILPPRSAVPAPGPFPPAASGRTASGPAALLLHLGAAAGDEADRLRQAVAAGVPVIRCPVSPEGVLAEMFRWEVAVAVFAHEIGVDPYDQPDIDGSKALARQLIAGRAAAPDAPRRSRRELSAFLRDAAAGGLALNAFGHRNEESVALFQALQRDLAATLGTVPAVAFGPSLLHTLGQLEKGGPPDLSVLMVTWGGARDLPIPAFGGEPAGLGCGALLRLLTAADHAALGEAGRRVFWLDAGEEGLAPLAARIREAGAASAGADG